MLYGNIGIKVIYAAVFRDLLHFPGLETKKGKLIWVAFGKTTSSITARFSADPT